LDRTSLVRTDIHQDSSENQQRLNRQTAQAFGLRIKPGYDFSEPGKSASKPITRRELERGINAVVKEKAVEALLVSSVDRLSRLGVRHVCEMLDAVDAVGGRIIFNKGNLDSSQPASRAIIAFLSEQARDESNMLSWRIETWREGCRLKGKWTGRVPYGFSVTDGKLVPHPLEAPIVRRIVAELLGGSTLVRIAKGLNEDGIPSPAAAKAADMRAAGREPRGGFDSTWRISTLSRVLRNPALVGWQKHNGRIVLGPDGDPVSFGDGILEPGEHAQVLAELERRTAIVRESRTRTHESGSKTGGGRPPRLLLIGMARCDSCSFAMTGQPVSGHRPAYYRCSSPSLGHNCPAGAYIKVSDADEEVIRQLRLRLGAMEPDDPIVGAIAERWRELTMPEGEGERALLQFRLDAVRGRIVDLEEARYVRGEFVTADDLVRWDGMMDRLKARRDTVVQELEELGPPPDFDLNTLRATYSIEVWDATPLQQRRKLLQVAVTKIIVSSAHKRPVPAKDRLRVVLVGETV
jgi:DNA invertase Pin-like site-specific DNA recombinase